MSSTVDRTPDVRSTSASRRNNASSLLRERLRFEREPGLGAIGGEEADMAGEGRADMAGEEASHALARVVAMTSQVAIKPGCKGRQQAWGQRPAH